MSKALSLFQKAQSLMVEVSDEQKNRIYTKDTENTIDVLEPALEHGVEDWNTYAGKKVAFLTRSGKTLTFKVLSGGKEVYKMTVTEDGSGTFDLEEEGKEHEFQTHKGINVVKIVNGFRDLYDVYGEEKEIKSEGLGDGKIEFPDSTFKTSKAGSKTVGSQTRYFKGGGKQVSTKAALDSQFGKAGMWDDKKIVGKGFSKKPGGGAVKSFLKKEVGKAQTWDTKDLSKGKNESVDESKESFLSRLEKNKGLLSDKCYNYLHDAASSATASDLLPRLEKQLDRYLKGTSMGESFEEGKEHFLHWLKSVKKELEEEDFSKLLREGEASETKEDITDLANRLEKLLRAK